MSHVSDMILMCSGIEDTAIEQLNAWCRAAPDCSGQTFARIDMAAAGGGKVFTQEVWACSGNYFPVDDLIDALPRFDWHLPDDVVLIASTEGEIAVGRALVKAGVRPPR